MVFAFVKDSVLATNIYIDGFNLYYGSLRDNPQFKWLDPAEMCRRLLSGREISKIRYFTARLKPLPHDPQIIDRQNVYLRALGTVPNLTIHFGRFATRQVSMPRAPLTYPPGRNRPEVVSVIRTEEKRSDVNLATHLLVDCFDADFDDAVVVCNDSDLMLPIEMVVKKFGKSVGMINPHPQNRLSSELARATTFQIRSINRSVLARSQFPQVLTDDRGEFRRPSRWR